VAATHGKTIRSDSGSRLTYSLAAVSERKATSEPSTRNTRGPPPGARLPGTTSLPGRNPNSINRLAISSGSSSRSITHLCPVGRSARVNILIGGGSPLTALFGDSMICDLFSMTCTEGFPKPVTKNLQFGAMIDVCCGTPRNIPQYLCIANRVERTPARKSVGC
jgi:hypothetical protein